MLDFSGDGKSDLPTCQNNEPISEYKCSFLTGHLLLGGKGGGGGGGRKYISLGGLILVCHGGAKQKVILKSCGNGKKKVCKLFV